MPTNNLSFSVIIKPNAKENKILGWHDEHLKIAIKSAPIDGKANKALIDALSVWLEVPKKNINIISGEHSRIKKIRVHHTEKTLNDITDHLHT